MTEIALIRHAPHDHGSDRLVGRMPGVHLSPTGHDDLRSLVAALHDVALAAVYCGPLERTLETAQAVANDHRLDVHVHAGLHEVDYGEWTGRVIPELDADSRWRIWNEQRGTAAVPGGESMRQVQDRALSSLREIQQAHATGTVAVVTHAEVVRAVLAHFLDVPLDRCLDLDVRPASVSVLALQAEAGEVRIADAAPDDPELRRVLGPRRERGGSHVQDPPRR